MLLLFWNGVENEPEPPVGSEVPPIFLSYRNRIVNP